MNSYDFFIYEFICFNEFIYELIQVYQGSRCGMATRTCDCQIGLVMTGQIAKISDLETFQNGFAAQSIQKKNVTSNYWTPLALIIWVQVLNFKRTKQLSGVDLKNTWSASRVHAFFSVAPQCSCLYCKAHIQNFVYFQVLFSWFSILYLQRKLPRQRISAPYEIWTSV